MLALSTGSLYNYGLERAFALAAEAGFEGVEVLIDERWDTRQADFLHGLEERYKLPITSLHSPFAWRMDGWEGGQLPRLQKSVTLAQALGAKVVVAHLPFRWHEALILSSLLPRRGYLPIPAWPREAAFLRWLLTDLPAYEEETGVAIGMENLPCKRWGPWRLNPYRLNPTRLSDLPTLARLPHLTMDTTHLGTWDIDVLAAYEQMKGRLVNIHLSNYNGQEHRLPWDGKLPLAQLLGYLRRDGYKGQVTVELGPDVLGAGEDDVVRENLAKIIAFCRTARLEGM